jgi:hypothetical protein
MAMRPHATKLFAFAAIAALVIGCSSSASPAPTGTSSSAGPSSAAGSGGGTCNEPCILFHVTIAFSGLDNVSGSFVDTTNGEGESSCSEWVTGDSVGFAQGPGTQTAVLDGKSLSFLFRVGKPQFHGPGTYSDTMGGGLTIGSDTFFGNTESETLNADGSGKASFTDMEGGSVSGPNGKESGSVSWTCST